VGLELRDEQRRRKAGCERKRELETIVRVELQFGQKVAARYA
jgi:hypothetical protein